MRTKRLGAAIAAASLLVLGLTGCTPASIGTPSDTPPPQQLIDQDVDGPWAYTVDGALYLALGGSSSCPTVPTALDSDGDELTVTVSRGLTLFCTADMQTVIYELPVDAIPDRVTLVDGDQRTTLDVSTA